MINKKDYVILLHGLWRTSRSMKTLEESLLKDGYEVINIDYPSKTKTIEDISSVFLKQIIVDKCPDKKKKIHFVTHSMGGIIVRHFLAENKLKNLGRVVMLAPPNQGSKMANVFSKIELTNHVAGPALKQLTTHKKSLPKSIAKPDYDVGVIAGKFDGKVSAKFTKLDGMKDFLVVPSAHSFIMEWRDVIEAVKNFIKNGKF
ncbi:MAG: hypothetical protein ACD_72C00122G0004 [uncultured bacterium]|nr:MAG: hypothetical protein ACD_72C00122G0004 [uncultured bacterium]